MFILTMLGLEADSGQLEQKLALVKYTPVASHVMSFFTRNQPRERKEKAQVGLTSFYCGADQDGLHEVRGV